MTPDRKPQAGKAPNFLTMSFDMVTIRVGDPKEAVSIPVYCDVLTAVSPYFLGAFEGCFKEAIDRTISLTDVSEQTFRIFLRWAHMQTDQQSTSVSIPTPQVLLCQTKILPYRPTNLESAFTNSTSHIDTVDDGVQSDSNSDSKKDLQLNGGLRPHGAVMFACDEDHYHLKATDELYSEDVESVVNYRSMMIAYLRLYIFADKYNIHQLRDDIMTSLLSQTFAGNWWPETDDVVIAFAYDNLPKSSTFLRFQILSAAFLWLSEPSGDCATKMQAMQAMNPDFAFEVSLAQAQRLQNHFSGAGGIPFKFEDCIPNSCVFHEHLVYDKDQCRKRIVNSAHIFTSIIDACVQDGLAMSTAQVED